MWHGNSATDGIFRKWKKKQHSCKKISIMQRKTRNTKWCVLRVTKRQTEQICGPERKYNVENGQNPPMGAMSYVCLKHGTPRGRRRLEARDGSGWLTAGVSTPSSWPTRASLRGHPGRRTVPATGHPHPGRRQHPGLEFSVDEFPNGNSYMHIYEDPYTYS